MNYLPRKKIYVKRSELVAQIITDHTAPMCQRGGRIAPTVTGTRGK